MDVPAAPARFIRPRLEHTTYTIRCPLGGDAEVVAEVEEWGWRDLGTVAETVLSSEDEMREEVHRHHPYVPVLRHVRWTCAGEQGEDEARADAGPLPSATAQVAVALAGRWGRQYEYVLAYVLASGRGQDSLEHLARNDPAAPWRASEEVYARRDVARAAAEAARRRAEAAERARAARRRYLEARPGLLHALRAAEGRVPSPAADPAVDVVLRPVPAGCRAVPVTFALTDREGPQGAATILGHRIRVHTRFTVEDLLEGDAGSYPWPVVRVRRWPWARGTALQLVFAVPA